MKIWKWKPYLIVLLLVTTLTLLLKVSRLGFDEVNIALLFLLPVLYSAVYWGIRPALFAAGLCVLAFDFFFVKPVLSFTVEDLRYLLSFAVFLVVASLTASLSTRLRQQLELARRREAHTASLYALSREFTAILSLDELLTNVSAHVSASVGEEIVLYLQQELGDEELKVYPRTEGSWGNGETERAIAGWVVRFNEMAGRGTNNLRETNGLFIPMRTDARIYGVLAVNLKDKEMLSPDTQRLLEAFGGLIASAIDRVKLGEEAKLAQLTADSERLRTAILNSVSHELRTPLATIIGSATGLIDADKLFTAEDRLDLLTTIRDGAMRMNRLVSNLLGMAKLESGMLSLRRTWCDVEDLIGVALSQVRDIQQRRVIKVQLPPSLPLLPGDDVLLEQVLNNLLGNAIKYSPDGSPITIAVTAEIRNLMITVTDEGIGIPPADTERVFDKFFRVEHARKYTGTGLGLAICKGIVEAHGGKIYAGPGPERGTRMTVVLPLEQGVMPKEWVEEGREDNYDDKQRRQNSDY